MSDFRDGVCSGDARVALEALRDRLVWAIESVESVRDVAPLSNQLARVLADLRELVPGEVQQVVSGEGVTPLDAVRARRAARKSS